jgi:hypothetical protein
VPALGQVRRSCGRFLRSVGGFGLRICERSFACIVKGEAQGDPESGDRQESRWSNHRWDYRRDRGPGASCQPQLLGAYGVLLQFGKLLGQPGTNGLLHLIELGGATVRDALEEVIGPLDFCRISAMYVSLGRSDEQP